MTRVRRLASAAAAACLLLGLTTACGSSTPANEGPGADTSSPVAGGTLRVIQTSQPRSLDPAALSNTWAHQPVLGNALYGTLMINNPDTNEIEYKIATDFTSTDGGKSFVLSIRDGVTFTDGTPFDAEAVRFNWARLADPALGSTAARYASAIAASDVIDPQTLRITLQKPNPFYPEALVTTSMNWIASPAALQLGAAAFDQNPIGAGPFTLDEWSRQDSINLEKNPGYYDAPKPYLDSMTITSVTDINQRFNVMASNGADFASETSWSNLEKAEKGGLQTEVLPTGGGQFIGMNTRRAPFDDERARRAVALAVDPAALNDIVYEGIAEVPETMFPEASPFFADIPLNESNSAEAQKLFDELAAEGKPLDFTFMSYPVSDSRMLAEAVQTQLSAYDNVNVEVEVLDFSAAFARSSAHDFDMLVSSAITQDPDNALWTAFHSTSAGNFLGIADPELDAALESGRFAQTESDRQSAYETAQRRLAALDATIWYVRAAPAVIASPKVNGIKMFTLGSPLPEELWMTN